MKFKLANNKKVFVETSWDDGSHHDLRLHQLLLEYRLPAMFYIPSIARELTDEQIKELARHHEIGGHTETHRVLSLISPTAAEYEIKGCKESMEWLIGREVTSFCYPKGKYRKSDSEAVKLAGFKEARTVDVLSMQYPEDPYRKATTVHVFQRREYLGTHWLSVAIARWNAVMDPESPYNYFHLWGHSWEIDQHGEWENLEKFFSIMYESLRRK